MKNILENRIHMLGLISNFLIGLIVLILPQINVQEYVSSTITSKCILFLYGCLILFFLFNIYFLISKNILFSFNKIDILLIILGVYVMVNRYCIQLYYGFSIRYLELLGLFVFYFILRIWSLKFSFWLLLSIVVSGIIQSLYGILQLFGFYSSNHPAFNMTGSFFNPGPYAGFLVCVWSIALGIYLFKDDIINQFRFQEKDIIYFKFIKYIFEYIPLLGLISIAVILPALQSRASWVAFLLINCVLIDFKYHFLKKMKKKMTIKFQSVIFLFFLSVVCAVIYSLYCYKKASADGRNLIWKVTSEMILDNPVFGVGFDMFNAKYMNHQADYFLKKGESYEISVADNTYYAFNEWIQFTAENGFLGLLFLIIIFLVLFRFKYAVEYKILAVIAKTGLLTISVFACFSYPMQILPIKIILIFCIAVLSNIAKCSFQFRIKFYSRKKQMIKTCLVILSFVTIYTIYNYVTTLNQSFIIWRNALISHQYGDYKTAIEEFGSIYPVFKKNGEFLMNYGKTLSMASEHVKAIEVLEETKFFLNNTVVEILLGNSYSYKKQYDNAETAYKHAINMIPSKFYSSYLLAKLYDDSKQINKALIIARKILEKDIKIPSSAIKEIQDDMKKILKKYEKCPDSKNEKDIVKK